MTGTDRPRRTEPSDQPRRTEPSDRPRRTWQRAAIDDFLSHDDSFRTAQEIHAALLTSGSKVGLATVYRTLQTMAGNGEVDTLRRDDTETAYRRCGDVGHHHHLVCRSCGYTVDVDDAPVRTWTDEVATEHGFTDVEHQVEVFGRCARCRR